MLPPNVKGMTATEVRCRIPTSAMKKYTKRFVIVLHNGIQSDTIAKFGTVEECVEWCNNNDKAWQIYNYFVEDREEDIEIEVSELMEAWARGERPEDLQMF